MSLLYCSKKNWYFALDITARLKLISPCIAKRKLIVTLPFLLRPVMQFCTSRNNVHAIDLLSLAVFSITACVNLPMSRGQIFVEFIAKTRFNGTLHMRPRQATEFIRCATICVRRYSVAIHLLHACTTVGCRCGLYAVDGHAMIKLEVNRELRWLRQVRLIEYSVCWRWLNPLCH